MKKQIRQITLTLLAGSLLLIGLGAWQSLHSPRPFSYLEESGQKPAPADTLRRTVSAGDPLILALPDTLDGQRVRRYAPVQIPALSWLVDRSFFWETRSQDTGRHELLFEATFSEEASPDTLVLTVRVE